jgi:hypothetical protein
MIGEWGFRASRFVTVTFFVRGYETANVVGWGCCVTVMGDGEIEGRDEGVRAWGRKGRGCAVAFV